MQIITGIGESEHVTSMQHRAIFEMVIGDNSYILNKGELLEPELQSNNALKIRSGMLAHHGCISEVAPNTYDEVAIGNGSQSMKPSTLWWQGIRRMQRPRWKGRNGP